MASQTVAAIEAGGDDLEIVESGLMTVSEAVEFARVSRSMLYGAIGRNELRVIRRGKRTLIPRLALMTWLRDGLSRNGRESN